ncbi:MAG: hypothetical protein WC829_05810 [Hyphomicrobium sp.]|jgi:hypothetical protein
MPTELPTIKGLKELLGASYTEDIEWAWPDVTPKIYPCGSNILVQLKVPRRKHKLPNGSFIILPDESIDMDKVRSQTALVRAVGPAAFRHRTTLELWPEGAWCEPGSFIRTPMYGGDRMEVSIPGREAADTALFVTFRDLDCLSIVIGDPLDIKTS